MNTQLIQQQIKDKAEAYAREEWDFALITNEPYYEKSIEISKEDFIAGAEWALSQAATTGELPATVSKGYTSGFEEGFNEGQRKGELPAGPAIDLEHFLDYVGLNYTPVKFNDGVCWDLDDSEAPVSSEEVIQDYKEQFGSTPVAPKEEGEA
jgi:hypothetical protein